MTTPLARILLIEDNDMNRDMLSRRLARRGYEVLTAVDGDEGVRRANADRPDIVLMDMSLPVLDGWEATRRLKTSADTRDIPVIVLTAHAMAGDRERAIDAGCDEFDTKPIEFDRLLGKIETLLRLERTPQPGARSEMTVDHAGFRNLATLRRLVTDACTAAKLPGTVADALELAVDEACTNIIEHGYGGMNAGPLTLTIECDAGGARVSVTDRGKPFAPDSAPPVDRDGSWRTRRAGGVGWHLIRSIVDDVAYQTRADGTNRLTLVKRATPARSNPASAIRTPSPEGAHD